MLQCVLYNSHHKNEASAAYYQVIGFRAWNPSIAGVWRQGKDHQYRLGLYSTVGKAYGIDPSAKLYCLTRPFQAFNWDDERTASCGSRTEAGAHRTPWITERGCIDESTSWQPHRNNCRAWGDVRGKTGWAAVRVPWEDKGDRRRLRTLAKNNNCPKARVSGEEHNNRQPEQIDSPAERQHS